MIRSSLLGRASNLGLASLLGGLTMMPASVNAACTLGRIAALPVTMADMQPLVPVKINGVEVMFVADSGAFYSTISPARADELHLHSESTHGLYRMSGVGGDVDISVATVKTFTLAKNDIHNVEFIVGGSEVSESAIGLLGQNIWHIADVEYDLANGMIRMFRPHGCDRLDMAYWTAGKPYSVVPISWSDALHPHTMGTAQLNGKTIRVMFDTGAGTSVLSVHGARLAGIKTDGPGVKPAGFSGGIGRRMVATWLTPVASFKLGEEEITNSQLRIGDIGIDADMLIGADFFLSHRVYVSNTQNKLYFSYNGGPVFNLSQTPMPRPASPPKTASEPTIAATGAATSAPVEATDADGFARRGAAFFSRHDNAHALEDITQAVELGPSEPRYLEQRAKLRMAMGQPFLAMADMDAALKLKPEEAQTHADRAVLRIVGHDLPGAREDLDAAVASTAKQAEIRLELAELYSRADMFEPAIAQYGAWVDAHPDDSRMVTALNGRCWARGLANRELDKALSDCNTAVRLGGRQSNPLDSRGLIHLRRGEFDRAISDYDAALAISPKSAWSLYGRGLAKLKAGRTVEGQADIAAAKAIAPHLPERAAGFGLAPPTAAAAAAATTSGAAAKS